MLNNLKRRLWKTKGFITKDLIISKMIFRMLWTLCHMMLQNNNKHLQNPDARVFHHPRKFCIKRFRDAVLNIKQNPLKLFVIFLILVRWFLNLLLKSGVEVIVFISLSVKLLLRRGPPEDISNFLNFRFHKVCFAMLCCVMVMYYLKLIVKRNRYFIIQINSNH